MASAKFPNKTDLIKTIMKIRITGEISMPPSAGIKRLIGLSAGSMMAFSAIVMFLAKLFRILITSNATSHDITA